MHTSATHALDDFLVIDVDFDYGIYADTLILQRFSLCQGARKAVEKEPVRAVLLGNSFLHQTQNNIIRNQTTGIRPITAMFAREAIRVGEIPNLSPISRPSPLH